CVFASTSAPVGGSVTNGTGCNLTTGWEVNASYEHYWTPQFHESFYGGIEEIRYNSQANNILRTAEGAGTGTLTGSLAVLVKSYCRRVPTDQISKCCYSPVQPCISAWIQQRCPAMS